jgi:DNA-binding transcriptional regulator YhcF (GntR family)
MEAIIGKSDGLALTIKNRISEGVYCPGMRLPSEWNLVETFSISRTTVRIALQELEDEGLISRKRGLGTFVREDAGSILKPRKQEVKLRVSFVLHNNQAGNFFFRDVIGFFRESADESIQIRVFFQNYLKPEIYAKAGSDVLIIENGAFGDDIVYELNDFAGRTILLNTPPPPDTGVSESCRIRVRPTLRNSRNGLRV